jgi:hypothetical protein
MNDCQTIKTVHINMGSAVDEKFPGEITLYPNPNHGSFRISATEMTGDFIIRIVNNSGQLVYNRTLNAEQISNETIDVQHLPRGIYHLLLQNNDSVLRTKLVID